MGSSANLLARISADASPFTRAIGEVNAALDAANRKAQATSGGFRALGDQLSSIGNALTLGVTVPVIGMGAAFVNSAANMDSLKRGLIAVSGSAEAAERQFVGLKEVAKLPGLGLKEAVQGSINLQALGNSAEQSQRILKVFGNALATVGRGREDLAEAIRQLGQLGARGQVTADNLKPLIERIPQLATIIKEKFGAEALGDPAKVFKQLGVDSKQFIEIILTELGKLPMVTGGAKNAIENFKDAVDQASARIGEKLLPSVEALLPKLEKLAVGAADAVDGFTKLSPAIQDLTLAIAGLVVLSGPLATITGNLVKFGIAVRAVAGYLALLTPQTAALGGALAYVVSIGPKIVTFFQNMADELDPLNDKSNDFVRTIAGKFPQMEQSIRALNSSIGGLNGAPSTFQILSDTTGTLRSKVVALGDDGSNSFKKLTAAIVEHREKVVSSYEEDFKTAVLKERLSLLQSDYTKRLNDGVIALSKYKDAAGAANAALTEMRITESAPALNAGAAPSIRNLPQPIGIPSLPTRSNGDILNEAQTRAAGNRNVGIVRESVKDSLDAWKQAQTKIRQAVSTITTDFSRGIADIITNGGKVGEMFQRLGKQIANTLIRTVIEGGINQVTKSLAGLLTSLGGVGAKVGVLLGGSLPTGVIKNASGSAGTIASSAGQIGAAGASAAGSAGGSIGSAVSAANPITAMVTAVSSVVTAISSVVSNFQFAAMNKTLDLIEREVRYTKIYTGEQSQSILWCAQKTVEYLGYVNGSLDDIRKRMQDGVASVAGGLTVNITVQGSLIGGPNVAAELSQMVVSNLKLQGVRA